MLTANIPTIIDNMLGSLAFPTWLNNKLASIKFKYACKTIIKDLIIFIIAFKWRKILVKTIWILYFFNNISTTVAWNKFNRDIQNQLTAFEDYAEII